jgi:hypothetical protein
VRHTVDILIVIYLVALVLFFFSSSVVKKFMNIPKIFLQNHIKDIFFETVYSI